MTDIFSNILVDTAFFSFAMMVGGYISAQKRSYWFTRDETRRKVYQILGFVLFVIAFLPLGFAVGISTNLQEWWSLIGSGSIIVGLGTWIGSILNKTKFDINDVKNVIALCVVGFLGGTFFEAVGRIVLLSVP